MTRDLASEWPLIRRGQPPRAWAVDAAIAVALTTINVLLLLGFPRALTGGRMIVSAIALTTVFVALLVRRVAPWGGLVGILAAAVAMTVAGAPLVVIGVSPLVAVYSAAAWLPRRHAVAALAVTAGGLAVVEVMSDFSNEFSTVAGNALVLGASWGVGMLAATRQRYVAALEARTAELEEAQHELARQAVIDERLRIARELHDVVAHAVSVITVRSGIAAHVADTRPEEAASALAAIEQVGRQALDDLRRMLGVLRSADTTEPTAPLPGIADLHDLVVTAGAGTIEVDLRIEGDVDDLEPGMQLTAYRLVQEALTNAIRHGGAHKAVVQVTRTHGQLSVSVHDTGHGCGGSPVEGLGLRGMRERVAMYGGRLQAGNAHGGGFRVDAVLDVGRAGE